MATGISRRSFVSAAAACTIGTAGAAAIRTAHAEEGTVPPAWDSTVSEQWDREAQIVVLGCGIAGACGAVEAYDLGLDVLVVNAASDITDCCCTLSGGALCGYNSSLQQEAGIEDSAELMIADIKADGRDMGDPEVIRAFVDLSGETIDWLEDLGCDVNELVTLSSPSHSVARTHNSFPSGNGLGWMEGLKGAIEERGIELMADTYARKLYRDADGVVVGAHVETKDGQEMDVRATQGVLLAVGGLGNNYDLWDQYCLPFKEIKANAKKILSGGPAEVSGDGYRMLEEINGYCYPTPPNYGGGGVAVSNEGPASGILLPFTWKASVVEVNAEGKRFNNEASFHEFYDVAMPLKQPGMWHVCIFDEKARTSPDGEIKAQPIIDKALENGMESVKQADTIEELAEMFGLPVDEVVKSVEEFNTYVENGGADEFGRDAWEGEKIATPPFWGVEENVIVATSKGGSRINAQAQVLDRHNQVIPHLYAAGEVAFFPVFGDANQHLVGGCNAVGANFGRIAARNIANEEPLA